MSMSVIVGTYSAIPGPLSSPTVPVFARLPGPPKGDRWVGPIPALVTAEGWESDTFAGMAPGGESTACFTPCDASERAGTVPEGCAVTDTSGRACARTAAGWWVAVPADRPSSLACQVRGAGGTREVGPYYRGPLRDEWLEDLEPIGCFYLGIACWRATNLILTHRTDEYGWPAAGVEVVWCPFPVGSQARAITLRAAGVVS